MPVLSILVPTHERARYALPTVETLLARSRDAEIIVCDTSEVDAFRDLSRKWQSSGRLKIIRPGSGLSVVGNFNAALAEATGDYLCFIGDDDLIADDLEEIAAWAGREKFETVGFSFPVQYYWPDYMHRREPERYSATLWYRPFSAAITGLDAKAAVRLAMARPGLGVFDMARAYCGLVSRDLIQRVQEQHGPLFGGVSPDIYSAVLLSAESRSSVHLDYPGVTPGASGASTAGKSAAGTHVGPLRENAHISAFGPFDWHPLVPEFYSVPTVWSYSLIRAVEAVGSADVNLDRVNLGRLYARCLLYYPAYRSLTWQAMKRYVETYSALRLVTGLLRGGAGEFLWLLQKLRQRIAPGSTHETRLPDMSRPEQAAEAVVGVTSNTLATRPAWTMP